MLLAGAIANANVVFEQPLVGAGPLHASSWLEPDGSDSDMYSFDNFRLAKAETISEVRGYGGYAYGGVYGKVWNFKITLYPSILGDYQPDVVHPITHFVTGNTAHETLYGSYGSTKIYSYSFTLPRVFSAKANTKYWIQIEASQNGFPDWGLADGASGEGNHFMYSTGAHRYWFGSGDTAFSLVTPDASSYTINASAEPSVCGTVTEAGTFAVGSSVHLTATPNAGYRFVNWTENGTEVSTSGDYIFQATSNRTLVANMVAQLKTLKVSPNPVPGGLSPTGTIRLSVPAPVDTAVELTSSMPVGVGVPNPVWIPAGETTATFAMTSYPWNSDYQVWITAKLGPISKTASVIVKAPTVASVSLSPTTMTGGATATLTVKLASMAPQMGYQVWLSSDNPAIKVPPSISFDPWATTATCLISTKPVVIDQVGTITSVANGVTKTATLTLKAGIPIKVNFSPASVVGGKTATMTVTMSGPAPDPVDQIWLSSSDPCATVPQFLMITPGATTASCTITTLPVGLNTSVTLSVRAHGVTKSAVFTVRAPSPNIVSLSPASVVGGTATTFTVKLNGVAPPSGYTVSLGSSDPSAVVPATLAFGPGQSIAKCTITILAVTAQKVVTLTATANGISKAATLTINP